MEWIKIPTDSILYSEFKNSELIILIKYQALYCQLEKEPTDAQLNKIFTKKELKLIKTYAQVVQELCKSQINSVSKKRNRDKENYKQKQLVGENSASGTREERERNVVTDKIREDKIREDKKRVEKKNASRTPSKLRFDDVVDWGSLFEFWEQNKKGGRYANAESRQRMLARLKELTSEDFDYAKEAIVYAVDNKYQGFSDGSKLYFKKPSNKNQESWDDYWLEMEEKLAKKQGAVA